MSSIFNFSDFNKVDPVSKTLEEAGQVMSDFYDKKVMEAMTAPNPLIDTMHREMFFDYLREYPTLKWWQFLRKRTVEREVARLAIVVVPKMVEQLPKKQNVIKFRRYGRLKNE